MDTTNEEEFELNGIIEEVSGQLFVVSAEIHGERRFLWAQRDRFFYNGRPHGETLDEVLEIFMPIDMIVRSELGDYIVLAAWIGDKPEIIEVHDTLLQPVYGKQGNFCRSPKDGSVIIVALEGDFSVFIRKEVVYLDGYPVDNGTEDFMGQIVSFDAVPLVRKDISGAVYAATCVWIGDTAPRIVDRFQMHGSGECIPGVKMEVIDSDDEIELLESPPERNVSLDYDSETDDDVEIIEVIVKNGFLSPSRVQEKPRERSSLFEKFAVGTVSVIPSEGLALVNVCIDDVDVKVLLFRYSFGNCFNIRDVLSVGDRLCLLLRSASLFNGRENWIAVKACKGNSDPKRMAEMMLPIKKCRAVGNERVEESAVVRVPVRESTPEVCIEGALKELTPGTPERVVQKSSPGTPVERAVQKSSPLPADIEIIEVVVKDTATSVPMEIEDDPQVSVKVGTPQRAAHPVNTQNAISPVVVKTEMDENDKLPAVNGAKTSNPIVLKPLEKRCETQDVVLNGTGRLTRHLSKHQFYVVVMQSLPIKVLIQSNIFYANGMLHSTSTLGRQLGEEVSFDAVKLKKTKHSSGATHRAVLAWQGAKPTPQTVLKQAKLNPLKGELPFLPNTVYVGLVMEVPLFDCCIVKFGALPVLVQSKSLFVDPWTTDVSPILINDYLKFGDHVALTCRVEHQCVIAEICGALPSFDSLFGAIGTLDKKSFSVTTNDVNVSHSQAELRLMEVIRCSPLYLEPNEAYKAIIVEFPYRNYGIALVGEIRVLIHVNCLVHVQGKRDDVDSISELLKIGSTVLVWVERKTVQLTTYYAAKKARLIHDVSTRNKVVLKNCSGLVQTIKLKRITVQMGVGQVETDAHTYRLNLLSVPRSAQVNKVACKIRLFAPVRVNATLNGENDVVIHSVLLL